jgi:hypothetical protein
MLKHNPASVQMRNKLKEELKKNKSLGKKGTRRMTLSL